MCGTMEFMFIDSGGRERVDKLIDMVLSLNRVLFGVALRDRWRIIPCLTDYGKFP